MRKLLKAIFVIQDIKSKHNGLSVNKKRINPYNPISYLVIVLFFIVGILMFGFVGFWKEVDGKNPFKWQ